ncbi:MULTISPECIES: hypothetical protein [Myroides]|jgi:hypothetical protein|uniref:Uncharacterized protein n=1 Tax=Myroides odoratus TaxID=256 RepID=A0A9Q7EAB0_MYROD|nr:hypothetical protein [Myroides odoratus]MDH6599685.1 hypothetical protein [Myroides gitamensis]EHQ41584.1 hypothetical protein Myrod_0748 [Myroides odoratus DSM 2801]EKB08797.1 hypothetical protein HMPREF9716_00694 [Myroides odoratus CIP 103059]MCS4239056.1 hypothetical protein [Myroides odoratus]QQT98999.1 hypothetical protein I6I88_12350 [Myroides odoratus]
MTSNEIFELDTTSICELVGKRFMVSYKEERNGKVESVSRDKKLIALDYTDKQQVNHYIFSDGMQHFKVPHAQLVTMTQL